MIGLLGIVPKTLSEDGRMKTQFFKDFTALAQEYTRSRKAMEVLVSDKWTCRTLLDALGYYKDWKPVFAKSDEDFSKVFCISYSADALEMLPLNKYVFRDISDPKVGTGTQFDADQSPYSGFEALKTRLSRVQPNPTPGQQFVFIDMRPKFSI